MHRYQAMHFRFSDFFTKFPKSFPQGNFELFHRVILVFHAISPKIIYYFKTIIGVMAHL